MPMVRAMRMLNAVEAGTLTGAQLQTLLTADPGRLAELNVLLGMRGQARRMAAMALAVGPFILGVPSAPQEFPELAQTQHSGDAS